MKQRLNFLFILFGSMVLIVSYSCSQVVPLDGRGGGILAYSYSINNFFQIYAVNADGTGSTKILNSSVSMNHSAWSPDGKKIVCVGYVSQATWSIYTFDSDGKNLTRLTSTAGVWDGAPKYSPDGKKIAFTRTYPSQNNRNEIWIMNSDGTSIQNTEINGFEQCWSSDGQYWVYSTNKDGNWEIYSSKTDGSDVKRLTNSSLDEFSCGYSPDGSKILYSIFVNNSTEFYTMNKDGIQPVKLNVVSGITGFARWSPDGSMIAFDSDHGGKSEIYVMNSDGTNLRKVTSSVSTNTSIGPVWKPGIKSSISPESERQMDYFKLIQNFPNPFNPSTQISYEVKSLTQLRLELYDSAGKLIKTLVNRKEPPGSYSVNWDGTDMYNNGVASGMYFYRLSGGGKVQISKALLVR